MVPPQLMVGAVAMEEVMVAVATAIHLEANPPGGKISVHRCAPLSRLDLGSFYQDTSTEDLRSALNHTSRISCAFYYFDSILHENASFHFDDLLDLMRLRPNLAPNRHEADLLLMLISP